MLFEYFNEFLGDTFAKASGFPMPTENSNIYKKWSRDFGIDNYDEFKKWNKSNNSYRRRSSYRRRRGGW